MKNNLSSIDNIKDICTGCNACNLVCPQNCIHPQKDSLGFFYPKVDIESCVGCGLCVEKCHALHSHNNIDLSVQKCFYAWGDDKLRDKSSSGGAFSMIVDSAASDDTYIIGASFADDWMSVLHKICLKNDYDCLRKSKYVISEMGETFCKLKEILSVGSNAIFCGSPCQVSSLKHYLGKEYPNLLLIDFICHGISSQQLYEEHIKRISHDKKITNVDFRPSGCGWDAALKISFSDGSFYFGDQIHDFYLYNYFHNLSLRKCCYTCQYALNNHQSDITLADFWHAGEIDKDLLKEPGISLVICNTQKGIDMWSKSDACVNEPVDYRCYSYIYNNKHEWYDINERNAFVSHLEENGYDKTEHKFVLKTQNYDRIQKIKSFVKKILMKQ